MKKISKKSITAILLLAAAILLPIILGKNNNYFINILISFCYFSILASSLNLLIGYSGQISLGHSAFMAIGAYTFAILKTTYEINLLISIAIALLISFISGIILGLASSKLSAIYLAIATVGFANAVNLFITNEGWLTGGANGFTGIKQLNIFGRAISNFELYYIALFITILVFVFSYRVINSKIGRAMQAISTAPIAAASMGINVNYHKLLMSGVSAMLAGLAGIIYALTYRYLSADMFTKTSITLITMSVVGGLGSLFGPVLGAISIGILPELLRRYANYLDGVYGVLIVISMIFMPNGIYGSYKKVKDKIENYMLKKRNVVPNE